MQKQNTKNFNIIDNFARGKIGFDLQKGIQIKNSCYTEAFKMAGNLIRYFK